MTDEGCPEINDSHDSATDGAQFNSSACTTSSENDFCGFTESDQIGDTIMADDEIAEENENGSVDQCEEDVALIPDESNQSSGSVCKSKRKASHLVGFGGSFGIIEQIIEYQWPPKTKASESFVLQEQFTVFLGITSFKRKYPDLFRRQLDKEEIMYLKSIGAVTDAQCVLGLTALRSVEVTDIMLEDYPDKYESFKKFTAEFERQTAIYRQKDPEVVDSTKMADLRAKAIRSTTAWNRQLNQARKKSRRSYFDVATMTIQYPMGRTKKVDSNETNFGSYPAALLPSQFQNFYRRYSSEELNQLPLNSILNADEYLPRMSITDFRLDEPLPSNHSSAADLFSLSPLKRRVSTDSPAAATTLATVASCSSFGEEISARTERGEPTSEQCAFCCRDIFKNDKFIQCSKCGSCGHPTCMDMSEVMFSIAQTYKWECMECKPCSVCSKIDEEDRMLFCDRCDRGYHTFCVSLTDLPTGSWVCPLYCGGTSIVAVRSELPSSNGSAIAADACGNSNDGSLLSNGKAKPSSPAVAACLGTCVRCNVEITKANKVHHRSKFRDSGLCSKCVNKAKLQNDEKTSE